MMKRPKRIPQVAGAIALIAMAGYLTVVGRNLPFEWWGIRVSPGLYFGVTYIFLVVVVWLATRKLYRNLRMDANENTELPTSLVNNESSPDSTKSGNVYRYPIYLGILAAVVSVTWIAGPIISDTPEKPMLPTGYLVCFGSSAIALAVAIYLFRFSVHIDKTLVTVRGIGDQRFRLSDIASVQLIRSKGSLLAIVKLTDARIFRLSGMLKGFPSLLKILQAGQPKER
jgi:hypothetical protein